MTYIAILSICCFIEHTVAVTIVATVTWCNLIPTFGTPVES